MKKTALFLFFIFVTSLSFAQQSTEWNKNYVTFSPLRIIDFFNPGIEFAYQRNYGHFATQFSAAYLMGISTMGAKDISGYRFSLEEKYFIPRLSKQKIRLFASIEIAHNGISYSKEKAYIAENEEYVLTEMENYNYMLFNIKRHSVAFTPKFGLELRAKRFILEAGAGIGVAYHNVQYINKIDGTKVIPNNHFEDILSPMYETEGKNIMPNIALSFKIGYTF